jgi:hypothetical protein
MAPVTEFGSLADYRPGGVQVIEDDPRNYVFSNIFDVASRSAPYERVAVGKNFEYLIECVRAEGASPWYSCAHDEFAVCMDGEVKVELVKLDDPDSAAEPGSTGGHKLDGEPKGKPMGWSKIGRGHMALLPLGAAYRFVAEKPACMIIQTIQGPETIERWSEICQTESI